MRALDKRKIEGAPRWMVTFADLMALLFALFVLLLSFSEVDSDSFQKNAGPMRSAFGMGDRILASTAMPSIQPGQSGPGRSQGRGPTASQSPAPQTAGIMENTPPQPAKRGFPFPFPPAFGPQNLESPVVPVGQGHHHLLPLPP
ncbi:MAG: hypothetical protein H8E39_11545, partial [Alphaproteobacteria bacterium]|nr:hypothetical protein [Alphaproteobacteria bacterium]